VSLQIGLGHACLDQCMLHVLGVSHHPELCQAVRSPALEKGYNSSPASLMQRLFQDSFSYTPSGVPCSQSFLAVKIGVEGDVRRCGTLCGFESLQTCTLCLTCKMV
jgi:hypothetical protein